MVLKTSPVIKKLSLFSLTLTFLLINHSSIASQNLVNASDPFVGEWDFFDGINTYKLLITPSTVGGQDYRIDFTFPQGGTGSTDYCKKTSDISFNCPYEQVSVTRDAATYSVKLTDPFSKTYQYYAPNHQPQSDNVNGVWHWEEYGTTYKIIITQLSAGNVYQVSTSAAGQNGNNCGPADPDNYTMTKNTDGTEIFSYLNGYYSFKYDPTNHVIINSKSVPGSLFHAGMCVYLEDNGAVKFKKD